MLKPIKMDRTLCCVHWKLWPPNEIIIWEGQSAEELYRLGKVDGVTFQRLQVWERECGLLAMDEEKCPTCKHVRWIEALPPRVPNLVTMDGRTRVPIVDPTVAASLPSFRSTVAARPPGTKGSKKDAAWTKRARGSK